MNKKVARWPLLGLTAGSLCLALSAAPAVAHPHDDDDHSSTPRKEVRVYRGGDWEEAQVQGGYLGVRVQDIDRELQEARDLPNTEGALVNRVESESPAAKAGMKRGDVIVRLDGEEIEDSAELIREMREKKPGATVQIAAIRDGQRRNFQAKLGSRPREHFGDVMRWNMRDLDDLPERMERVRVNRNEVRRQLDELEKEVQSLQEEVRALREELRARNENQED